MCDDMNACTDDHCDEEYGCINLYKDCDDHEESTYDYCDQTAGCLHKPIKEEEGY
jgi:hypothetical protein